MSGSEGDLFLDGSSDGGSIDGNIDQTSAESFFSVNNTTTSNGNNGDGFGVALTSGLAGYSDTIIVTLIVIGSAFAVYLIIHYLLSRAAASLNLDKKQLKGVDSVIKLIMIVITITIILFQFSSISGAAAGAISVAVGTVIGFSSRNTISSAIAGIILLSARPFKLGDRIKLSVDESLLGNVVEISLIYTKIKTLRNELVTIPNQSLLQNQIINYSGFDMLAVPVEVSVGYENDKNEIKAVLIEAASKTSGIINDNPRPYVILKGFDDFAAVYEVQAYTERVNDYFRIQSDIRENIYELFVQKHIDLTTPDIVYFNNKKRKGDTLDKSHI
ncbi:MAG: mechanosensitive ion channel family protein [Nitrososphaeraceae archaeon]